MFPEIGGPAGARRPAGLLARIVTAILALAAMIVGLMFSVFLFAIALVAGVALFGWLWWKMRRALKMARQDPRFQAHQGAAGPATGSGKGQVIEGELIRQEWKDSERR